MKGLNLFIYKSLDRFIGRSCTKIACDSKSQRKFINESLGLSNVDIIGHGSIRGVNTSKFKAVKDFSRHKELMLSRISELSSLKDTSKDLVIGYVGRLHKDKGIDIAIEVCYLLANRNINAVLIAIGPIELNERKYFEKALSENKLIHLSYKEDIHQYYPLFDVLILPSIREGFGSVIIEAASCKVPVVASDIPGPRDFIISYETGVLVKRHTSVDFANAIAILHGNKALRRDIINNAYHKVNELYSEQFVSTSFKNWLTDIL